MSDNRRSEGERRTEVRLDSVERTVEQIAPVAVHLAEMNVRYSEMQRQQADLREDLNTWIDRLDRRLDPLHARLRKVEYAVLALGIAAISPKVGGPDVAHQVGALVRSFLA